MAAVRADYNAKTAELRADLEATRGEREQLETDLTCLKVQAADRGPRFKKKKSKTYRNQVKKNMQHKSVWKRRVHACAWTHTRACGGIHAHGGPCENGDQAKSKARTWFVP